jgi:hypothetical protein
LLAHQPVADREDQAGSDRDRDAIQKPQPDRLASHHDIKIPNNVTLVVLPAVSPPILPENDPFLRRDTCTIPVAFYSSSSYPSGWSQDC